MPIRDVLVFLELEIFQHTDFQSIYRATSPLIAGCLNAIYFYVRIRVSDTTENQDRKSLEKLSYLEFACYAICMLNCVYLFSRSRKYTFFKHPVGPNPGYPKDTWKLKSPHARVVPITLAGTSKWPDVPSRPWLIKTPPINPVGSIFRRYLRVAGIWLRRKQQEKVFENNLRQSQQEFWQLDIWDPSEGSLTVFTWFSPPQVTVMFLTTSSNWFYNAPLVAFMALLMHLLISAFTARMEDQLLLSKQIFSEYTEIDRECKKSQIREDESYIEDEIYEDDIDFISTQRRTSQWVDNQPTFTPGPL